MTQISKSEDLQVGGNDAWNKSDEIVLQELLMVTELKQHSLAQLILELVKARLGPMFFESKENFYIIRDNAIANDTNLNCKSLLC